jgi:hypothetical protein
MIYNNFKKYGLLGYFTALLKMRMLWDVITCRLAESYQRVEVITNLRNVDKYLSVQMLKHPKISDVSLPRTCDTA